MADLGAVHARLRDILLRCGDELVITKDGPGGMALEVHGLEGKPWGHVAGTRLGKSYVSVYLMPVYAMPELASTISPALAKRRQGKSCFNFSKVDELRRAGPAGRAGDPRLPSPGGASRCGAGSRL